MENKQGMKVSAVVSMPSHRIHELCGRLIGLPKDVVSFVDDLIDSGKCGVHDAGLEDVTTPHKFAEGFEVKILLERGVEALFRCLASSGKIDEAHLKAVALHFLLDFIDREVKAWGTWIGNNKEELIKYCAKRVENRVRGLEKRSRGVVIRPSIPLMPPSPTYYADLSSFIDSLVHHVHSLVDVHRGALEKCVGLIIEENKSRGVSLIEFAGVAQLLSGLCARLGASGLFYVNSSIPLPLVAATRKAFSELKRGRKVIMASQDWKITIKANSVEDFRERLLQISKEAGLM